MQYMNTINVAYHVTELIKLRAVTCTGINGRTWEHYAGIQRLL